MSWARRDALAQRTTFYVYAWVDQSGRVLYVGHTYQPDSRVVTHRNASSWWTPDLEFAIVSIHDTRGDAMRAERRAVQEFAPPHNVRLKGTSPHGGFSRYWHLGCRCDKCVKAQRVRVRENRRKRLASGELNHGTRSAYDAGCRCDQCRAARAAAYGREKKRAVAS